MQVASFVLLAVLCYGSVATDSEESSEESTDIPRAPLPKPVIIYLHINSDIRFRYARTSVTSRVSNAANVSQEVTFGAVLPDSAFISGFQMIVDEVEYNAYVRETVAAQQEYTEAVKQGRTAAHVTLSARDSKLFTVSVNIEALKKINFKLTYEQLLTRELGTYTNVVNLDPGQIVQDLRVTIRIREQSNITSLVVPALRLSNEIVDTSREASNSLATIERPSAQSAVIKFWPTKEQQGDLASDGIQGQLIVKYDVDRTSRSNEVLVSDGFFVHFFAPSDLPPLPKHVTFVLDVSGSMRGRKLEQLQEAMKTILNDLNPGDLFSIVPFSTTVQVWDHNATELELRSRRQRLGLTRWGDYGEEEETAESLVPTVIAPATEDKVQNARAFVNLLPALGATNINDALVKALQISRLGRDVYNNLSAAAENNTAQQVRPEPIILFLTDGKANVGPSEPNSILANVRRANKANSSIFCLALGDEADFPFLKKLSLRNTGFARKIYESSDTALQLRDFYRQVASPLLANVTFKYQPEQVVRSSVTRKKFRRVFSGSELVVAGRLQTDVVTGEVKGQSMSGNTTYGFDPTSLPAVPPEANTTTAASPMERLWAYLTIQQLLNKEDTEEDEEQLNYYDYYGQTDEDPIDALQLALRYSFVTPLTSLVVVKPNGTIRATTQDASGPAVAEYSGNTLRMASARPAAMPPTYHASGDVRTVTHTTAGPLEATPLPAPVTPANLSDVTWLSATLTDNIISLPTGVNGTIEILHLASANETNVAYTTCSTPGGDAGHCRHLKYCVLSAFTHDQSLFLPYFCRIESFVGVCCPDNLQPAVS